MADFHFIRPLWLLAFIALACCLYLLKRIRVTNSGWQQIIPNHLTQVLIKGSNEDTRFSLWRPLLIGSLIIFSLAGPTWQKLPQPVYQVARGSVIIMDMSYSMYATDITPNRLTRARFKAFDLLEHVNEGEVGLIAYAGDAFTISPLTEDTNNIKLLLPSLSPELMPELGSYPLAALELADAMLTNAGHIAGDIYWFTDGIESTDIQEITEWSRDNQHRLNVLAIGTATGAPIKLTNGELMKDSSGGIVIPTLNEKRLNGVAKRARGNYASLTADSQDIEALLERPSTFEQEADKESQNAGDQWQEFGPYLLLLVLPLTLSYFRRGNLLALVPVTLLIYAPMDAKADFWQNLWKTKDQQAQEHFNNEQYSSAAALFDDPMWRANALYKAENYEDALAEYEQLDSIDALYNKGNTLAKLGRLQDAIDAFEQVLAQDPSHEDAQANKTLTEKLLQQQQNQQQNQNQEQNQDQSSQSDQNQQQQQQDNQQQDNQQQNQSEQGEQTQQQNSQSQDTEQQQNDEQSPSEQQESQEQESKDEQSKQQEQAQNETDEEGKLAEQQARLAEQQEKETEQKHMQLLNKVTDDPYLLLRNKMQLEYQKRRHNRNQPGAQKKW
ncbi:VWA domain-containing protein [Thalassotalea fusca]